eukprot:TRINITY_DN97111_c0_g1_i1.p1 TRINITY_DN97111_c0_g1~~TRINITY_DN97111_c0_g1_i1.p1  ORF type:complete len:394 (-),score=59.81 TRINITY_DN97111_c0_g1_i1:100-1236(-)
MANRSGPVQVCQLWVQGNCQRGDRCRYSHQQSQGYNPAATAGRNALPSVNTGISVFGKCSHGEIPGLRKAWEMQRREAGVSSAVATGDRLCVGSQDGHLGVWKRAPLPQGGWDVQLCTELQLGSKVSSLLHDSESKSLFCGLATGTIRYFQEESAAQSDLQGHSGAVTTLLIHQAKLLSSSEDGTCRVWSYDAATGFTCSAVIQSELGSVSGLLANHLGLWMGCARGISCVSPQASQVTGSIGSPAAVTKIASCMDCVAATYADGAIRLFNASGEESKSFKCCGHATTALAVLRHPHRGVYMMLCGHNAGCISVYDLPECKLQGEFCSGHSGTVTAIVDLAPEPAFVTCGAGGETVIWSWEDITPVPSVAPPQTTMMM